MKRFIMLITTIAMICFGMVFSAPTANAADQQAGSSINEVAKKGTTSSTKCDKAPGSFVAPNGITVLNIKTCFNIKILKKMGCDTEAGKIERPAPPRDPKSKCKGKAKVKFKLKYETPDCPTGYIGGKLRLKLSIVQKLQALGLSKSIATGRVDTWARTKIKLLDKFKGEVSNDCVLVPVVTPPPVEYDKCPDIPGNQPADYDCNPTPPPPPVVEKPLYAQFGEFNDLEVNWTDDHCVTVNLPAGHTGEVFWTAKFGSFAVSTKDAPDMEEVCSFYVAPSEVPAGGTDTITVTATDKTTGHSVTQSTDPFVIHPTAGHPEKAQQ